MTVLTYGRVYEDCTEKELEYVQFATARVIPIKSVREAKQKLASAVRSINRMNYTYSGCDWCAEHGGGVIEMAEEQHEAKLAIQYLLAAGEEIKINRVCEGCFHYDATHLSVDSPDEFSHRTYDGCHEALCDKCGDLPKRKAWDRVPLNDDNQDAGIWFLQELHLKEVHYGT